MRAIATVVPRELGAAARAVPLTPATMAPADVFSKSEAKGPSWNDRGSLDERAFWQVELWQFRELRTLADGTSLVRSESKLQKHDANGKMWEWDAEAGQRVPEGHIRRILPHDGGATLAIESRYNSHRVVSVDAQGQTAWQWEAPQGTDIDSVRLGPSGQTFVKTDRVIRCLDEDGKSAWGVELPGYVDRMLHFVGPDGRQYFPSQQASRDMNHDWFEQRPPSTPFLPPEEYVRASEIGGGNFCYVVEPGGTLGAPAHGDMHTMPLRVGDRLIYGGGKGVLHCGDLAGGTGWHLQVDVDAAFEPPYEGRDGNIYVECRGTDSRLFVVSPDGKLVARHVVDDAFRRIGGDTYHVAPNGDFYYVGKDSLLHERRADGAVGRTWPGNDVEEMGVSDDGHLYVWREDKAAHTMRAMDHKVIDVHNLANGQSVSLPLRGYGHMAVLSDGVLEFHDGGMHSWFLRPRGDARVEALLGNLVPAVPVPATAGPAPAIVRGDGAIVVDGVRLPVRR